MSDCSTNAFKVPEGMCSCNRSRGYDDLLERCQQLEQVAKSLFKELTLEWLDLDDIKAYRDQLEALGIEVE